MNSVPLESPAPRHAPLVELASYAAGTLDAPRAAYDAARTCVLDAIACALASLRHPDCVRVLGPLVPGGTMIGGSRVIGTSYELDPVQAAFNLGAMIRWCADARSGTVPRRHPADALGAILAVADWRSRRAVVFGEAPLAFHDVLAAVLKAHEIQSALADASEPHATRAEDVLHVRVATAAVATVLIGGTQAHALAAISHAFADGAPLRPRARAGDVAARERWAAGDAASRGVRHALLAVAGEPPCELPSGTPIFGTGSDAAAIDDRISGLLRLGCGRLQESLRRQAAPAELEVLHRLADAASAHYSPRQSAAIAALCADSVKLDDLAVHDFVSALVKN